jgi:hypothetical protein
LTVAEMLGTAGLLSAPLTLIVAIGAVGAELGVLDQRGEGTLIVLAVATGVVFPVLFRLVAGAQARAGEAGRG